MERNINIGQSSRRDSTSKNYWKWSVWIETTPEILDTIESVKYVLHPSFPNRIKNRTSKKDKFKLNASGWGEFNIHIKIFISGESEPIVKTHYLKLFEEEQEVSHASKSVFISSALTDSEKVEELTDSLAKKNISVATEDTVVDMGSDWEDDINRAIKDSDVFILYGSKFLSKFQQNQLDTAIKSDAKIIIKMDDGDSLDKQYLERDNIRILKNNSDIIKLL